MKSKNWKKQPSLKDSKMNSNLHYLSQKWAEKIQSNFERPCSCLEHLALCELKGTESEMCSRTPQAYGSNLDLLA